MAFYSQSRRERQVFARLTFKNSSPAKKRPIWRRHSRLKGEQTESTHLNKTNTVGAGIVLAAILCSASAACADPNTFKSEFSISLYGLPLARTSFTTRVDGDAITIDGAVNSAGVGALFDDTRGAVTVKGSIADVGALPTSYTLNYVSGKRKKATRIGFTKGSVVSTDNIPPVRKKGDWVDVQPAHLKAVTDPLSGMVVRSDSLKNVCNRTIRVFDGQTRADFVMAPLRQGTYRTKGYSGAVAVCAVRFVPVSGYQRDKKQLEFLRKSKNIRISFAPVGSTGLFAPIAARVGTTVGIVSVDAVRFEALN